MFPRKAPDEREMFQENARKPTAEEKVLYSYFISIRAHALFLCVFSIGSHRYLRVAMTTWGTFEVGFI